MFVKVKINEVVFKFLLVYTCFYYFFSYYLKLHFLFFFFFNRLNVNLGNNFLPQLKYLLLQAQQNAYHPVVILMRIQYQFLVPSLHPPNELHHLVFVCGVHQSYGQDQFFVRLINGIGRKLQDFS